MPIHRGTPPGFPGPLRPRLLLASANQGKLRELRTILDGLPVELVGLAEAGLGEPPEVEETGDTFLENALLKGRAYAAWSGLAAVADDSGLEVDALGGGPGVRTRRYAGEDATDADNNDKLLAELDGVPAHRRGARYVCVLALALPGDAGPRGGVPSIFTRGTCRGRIATAPRGSGGFGYDPIFLPDGFGQTTAEMTAEAQDAISHRGRAFRALTPFISRLV